ncbi:GAK system ATP-grasp enzyme [Myxococcota bacterium]|nr:GAK system ATP-grasp enzyme [Myxococcota bacterium]MBU1612801.1 GAK system ATP-grasp enzyme [Pseudomonadota bacterium]
MKIGVIGIPDKWSSEVLADTLQRKTGFRNLIDMAEMSADLDRGRITCQDQDLAALDGIIVKKISAVYNPEIFDRLYMLEHLEAMGVRIFSRPEHIARLINRSSCTYHLRKHGIPMPPTTITESIGEAVRAVRDYGEAVLKPNYTTKARGMRLITADAFLEEELSTYRAEGNPFFYIQQRKTLPGYDFGVVFLGGKYLASYARRSAGSWNTTTHFGGRYEKFTPTEEMIDIAQRAQEPFGLDFTCVDMAETSDGLIVFEVSAFGGFKGLREACQIDAADLYSEYVIMRLKNG